MTRALWTIRILFLILCVLAGFMVSQVQPEIIATGARGIVIGFGFGGLLIAIDEMLKGFSLRAFSAAMFGLILGVLVGLLVERSGLFYYVDERLQWLIRLCLFVGFSYIGMVLAMRSNKEDFSLIIPYVRFAPRNRADTIVLLDTSAIIDGRIADLIESNFLEGIIVVPRFVLRELQLVADSHDSTRRARGQRGLDILGRIQKNTHNEVKIHEGDFLDDPEVDSKLVKLARILDAKLFTTDANLAKIAELQGVRCVNLSELTMSLKPMVLPGDTMNIRVAREGKERGQGVGYLNDGTMVVINQAQPFIGQQVDVQVLNRSQTSTGVIIFAELAGRNETSANGNGSAH